MKSVGYPFGMGHYTTIPWRVHIDAGSPSRKRKTSWYYGAGKLRFKQTIAAYGPEVARDRFPKMDLGEIKKPTA